MPHTWGEPGEGLPQAPDVIVGADVVYEQEHYAALVGTLHMLAAPHTVVYLSFRLRGMLMPCMCSVKPAGRVLVLCESGICDAGSTPLEL